MFGVQQLKVEETRLTTDGVEPHSLLKLASRLKNAELRKRDKGLFKEAEDTTQPKYGGVNRAGQPWTNYLRGHPLCVKLPRNKMDKNKSGVSKRKPLNCRKYVHPHQQQIIFLKKILVISLQRETSTYFYFRV